MPDDAFALLLAKARAEGGQFTDAEMSYLENQTSAKRHVAEKKKKKKRKAR